MNVDIIGVPVDLGANRRGVDMGPFAIRYAGLKKSIEKLRISCNDMGNINVPVRENIESSDSKMKFVDEIARVNKELSEKVAGSLLEGRLPLVLGGDHSIAAGSLMGTQTAIKRTGVIWIDAHGDFNNNMTTTSGNMHGMPLAACTGFGPSEMVAFKKPETDFIKPENVVLIGARDIDNEEAVLIKKAGITVFTMTDIDMLGMKEVMKKALDIATRNTEGFHLSFDLDAISPTEAPGVGTPVYGGLTFREAHLAAEMISESGRLRSMEFVEVNPILDHENRTGLLTVTLITSALGKRIL